MIAAVLIMTMLGAMLGIILGVSNRLLRVESNPLVDDLVALLPGSNCKRRGFAGCAGAVKAIVDGSASPTT
ncbi:MAG: hypothetical protein IPP84_15555 [Propionivibrio sp.]|uniref:(Fe-S)-binding protein n=1 Tax=Propionivibrio sp. TaxID=2212460 RepID=UPI0025F2ABFA|nr:(Fe-S)-binding protein [Propionivibrio sp.]MBL0209290.1 hypothetical protein [Propionivibrio sp.]